MQTRPRETQVSGTVNRGCAGCEEKAMFVTGPNYIVTGMVSSRLKLDLDLRSYAPICAEQFRTGINPEIS